MMNVEAKSASKMKLSSVCFAAVLLLFASSCSAGNQRGIADERSHFQSFIPMKQDVSRDGLKPVKPYFKRANRQEILRAIERACTGEKRGSSVFDPRTGEGYYVNCNPRNRQLLNGYIPVNARQMPHSRP
jgi:hypothetical protein